MSTQGLQMLASPKINSERLWASLMEMASIGPSPNGGCHRGCRNGER